MTASFNSTLAQHGKSTFFTISGIVFFIFSIIYYILVLPHTNVPTDFVILNALIVALSTYLILAARIPFGLFHVFYVFCLIFYGYIPLIEYQDRIQYWNNALPIFTLYTSGQVLSLASMLIFYCVYSRVLRPQKAWRISTVRRISQFRPIALLAVSVAAALAIYWVNDFSIMSVFIRGGDYSERNIENTTALLLYQFFLVPIPALALATLACDKKRHWFFLVALSFIFLAASPATGMPRFQAATLYIGVTAATIPALFRTPNLFSAALLIGIFFINPILDQFRYFKQGALSLSVSWGFIREGHFDSFQNFISALYIDNITYGRQLIGVFLFFVPRSLWPDKPVGSGAQLAYDLSLSFPNISMNLLGEGYMNFGIPGVFGFAAIFAYLCAKADATYWYAPTAPTPRAVLIYCFSLGLFFFMLRGDLLSSFAYMVGMWSAVYVVSTLGYRTTRQ